MALNPSIIMGAQAPQIQQRDPYEEAGQLLRIKALMGQNKMQDSAMADDQALRDAYSQSGGDSTRLRQILGDKGQYKAIQSLDAADLAKREKESSIGKNETDAQAKKLDMGLKQAEHAGALFEYARQNPNAWGTVKRQLALLHPEAAAQLPDQYDPQFVETAIANGQTLTQRLTAARDAAKAAEDARHNQATEGLTRRGQNMTDSRARDRLNIDQGTALADMGGPSQVLLNKQYGKAPAGYRWKMDGTQESIPGGLADQKSQTKAAAADDVGNSIAVLRDAYDRLEKGGGITSTNKGSIANLSAAASSSGIGQLAGRALGTQNQSARNDIAMSRPALLASLMKATGMSAKQMDSNAELKLWLATATDPTLDVESNRRALNNIERKYLGAQDTKNPGASRETPAKTNLGASVSNW